MNEMFEIIRFIAESVWYTLPFFLASIGLSVLVQMLKLEGLIKQAFAQKIGVAILLATLVGAFSPLCSCTVIPVVAGLLSSGVPLAPIMAFWIASPTMDPEILTLSIGILGFPMAVTRLVAALALSLGAGYLTWILSKTRLLETAAATISIPTTSTVSTADAYCEPKFQPGQPVFANVGETVGRGHFSSSSHPIPLTLSPQIEVTGSACTDSCELHLDSSAADSAVGWREHIQANWTNISWTQFGLESAKESWKWGKWLLLAFLMEALIIRYVPQAAVAQILGNENWFAIPLASLVGIPLYLTEISALPIVSGLMQQGMIRGAAIAFLIAGPVTTLPALTAVYGTVNKRVFVLYVTIGLGGAILFGILANLVLGSGI